MLNLGLGSFSRTSAELGCGSVVATAAAKVRFGGWAELAGVRVVQELVLVSKTCTAPFSEIGVGDEGESEPPYM